jgi:hypothetical protein
VIKDKLRIPSTRNICFICSKTNDESPHSIPTDVADLKLKELLNNLINSSQVQVDFKPRDLEMENKKSTRNCTKNVEYELQHFIVKTVLNKLLSKEEWLVKHDGTKWNSGQLVNLTEIASLFEPSTLTKLKQECGGNLFV